MTSGNCWIILMAIASVATIAPSVQARRVRHAPWLGGVGRCARCPPGWGVERRCSAAGDTACSPCRAGLRFAPHHSARAPCLPCSRCGEGLYAARACTATSDTRCAACLPPPPAARRNQDYLHKCAPLATYGLSDPSPSARSKTDMARSILSDPGDPGARSRLPHGILAEQRAEQQGSQYSLLASPGHQTAGPSYSVLTDDGPVRMAAAASPAPKHHRHRTPPPRPPPAVRLSSPISWGRPSAPSVNTRQEGSTTPRTKGLLPLHQRAEDQEDMNAEEVGRLML